MAINIKFLSISDKKKKYVNKNIKYVVIKVVKYANTLRKIILRILMKHGIKKVFSWGIFIFLFRFLDIVQQKITIFFIIFEKAKYFSVVCMIFFY